MNGELVDQGVYQYNFPDDQDVLAHAVDLEVVKQRTHVPSETTRTHEDFRTKLLERDSCCVWTGFSKATGMHIILHRRGDHDKACSMIHHSHWINMMDLACIPGQESNVAHCSLAPICELNLVFCSSGSNVSLTTGHMTNISTRSLPTVSIINVGAVPIDIRNGIYTDDTLHYQVFEPREVLSSEFVRPFLQSNHHLASARRRILSSKSPTSQRCASAIYLRMSVTLPNPDIRPNKSLPRINQTHSQTTVAPLS